jgi:hypothetical protein
MIFPSTLAGLFNSIPGKGFLGNYYNRQYICVLPDETDKTKPELKSTSRFILNSNNPPRMACCINPFCRILYS